MSTLTVQSLLSRAGTRVLARGVRKSIALRSALHTQASVTENAILPTISLGSLSQKRPSEASKLLEACRDHGFFYLGLENEPGQKLLQGSEEILALMRQWFRRPLTEKMRYHCQTVLHG